METDQAHSAKRKRVVLTLEEKLEVIDLKQNGSSYDFICQKYNIGATTIKDLMKKRQQIEEALEKRRLLGHDRSKKTLSEAKRPDVEIKLYDWISDKLERNELITNADIILKAQELSMEIYQEEWKASKGWLLKFKRRYNLANTKIDHEMEDEKVKYEPELYLPIEEEKSMTATTEEEVRLELTPLDAVEYLLNYVSNNEAFTLKEIISLQVIKDRIAEIVSSTS